MSHAPAGAGVHTEGGAHGAVAGTIHGGVHNYYEVPPRDASPEVKFASARRFLASRQATTARRLLDEVIAEKPGSSEVCFYWLLAFFSGRTFWELSPADRDQLTTELKRIVDLPPSRWSSGVRVIERLVLAGRARPDEPHRASGIEAEIDSLPAAVSAAVRIHLERLIQGSLKDELWQRDVKQAADGQKSGDRRRRVWKFFEPDPQAPRVSQAPDVAVSPMILALAGIAVAMVVAAVGTLGWLVVQRGDVSSVAALAVSLAAAATAFRFGVQWRFRDEMLRANEQERRLIRSSRDAVRSGGFADQVNQLYIDYLRRYAPTDERERAVWLADAYVPLCRLRNDAVHAYRESPVTVDKIKWLIRFQVKDLRQQWQRGEQLDPKPNSSVGPRLAAAACIALSLIALMWVMQSALRQDVLRPIIAFMALLFIAPLVFTFGLRIPADRKSVAVRRIADHERLERYWAEYRRWQRRLADRPTDMEMAQWLDCDRRLLLDRAIRAYRLKWSDIQAYASLEASGPRCRKARVKNGPWRYTRYRLLVFLLTSDGVRQLATELDFEQATFHHWDRTNYRYDAVAAVQVSVRDDEASEFHLHLVNGTDIQVAVTESGHPGGDEDRQVLADAAADATGLRHALFVLEGVAAEGRRWWKGPAYRRTTEARV